MAIERKAEGDVDPVHLVVLSLLYSRTERRKEALATVREVESLPADRSGRSFSLGVAHLGLAELDRGFEYLEQALKERSLGFRYLRHLPLLYKTRRDPRFTQLFARVNQSPPPLSRGQLPNN